MIDSTLTTRTRTRHFHIPLSDEAIKQIVGKNDDLIAYYADAWMNGERDNYSKVEYGNYVAGMMKGLAAIPEIKRELGIQIRKREAKERAF